MQWALSGFSAATITTKILKWRTSDKTSTPPSVHHPPIVAIQFRSSDCPCVSMKDMRDLVPLYPVLRFSSTPAQKDLSAQLFQSPETLLVNGRTCGVRFSSGSISNATRKIAINRNTSKIQILDRAVEMNFAGVCWTLTLSGLAQMSNIKWKINGKLCTYKGLFINDVIAFGGYRAPPPSPLSSCHLSATPPPLQA